MTTTYEHFGELPNGVADAVLQWVLVLADTKHMLGIRTSEWVNGGPALETAVAASAITQEELGHARSLCAFLKHFPNAPSGLGAENDLEARSDYACPPVLNQRWVSWMDVIAANVLLDRALSVAVEAFRKSSFAPLRGRAGKILQEEAFHRIFGDSWLARLGAWDAVKHDKMQTSLDHFWAVALAWFGADDDANAATLHQHDVLVLTPAEMRERWLAQVLPLLQEHGFRVPVVAPKALINPICHHS